MAVRCREIDSIRLQSANKNFLSRFSFFFIRLSGILVGVGRGQGMVCRYDVGNIVPKEAKRERLMVFFLQLPQHKDKISTGGIE